MAQTGYSRVQHMAVLKDLSQMVRVTICGELESCHPPSSYLLQPVLLRQCQSLRIVFKTATPFSFFSTHPLLTVLGIELKGNLLPSFYFLFWDKVSLSNLGWF